ncbi:MAG TPA: SDR family oxidoreductase [Rhizomicrobium sp.]|jgi:NAD(P)-dependent dehydrogenase (short-subunit alcohol dehydrogenase family)|nr:SDR family oxidoreductase [Rhizomicrobium sp.]
MVAAAERFRDRVVIVTGAMGGIGSATARRFAREGARLVLADIAEAVARHGEALTAECKSLGAPEALAIVCDVSREEQVVNTVVQAMRQFGRLDVIVNNAGFMLYKRIRDFSAEEWQKLMGINFMGAVFFTREALKAMKSGGAIVNVSSIHAVQTSPSVAPYAAAKAALVSLTRTTAIEGRDSGIRANAVLPGAIDTPMLHASPNLASGDEKLPFPPGQPDEIASVIAFLASDDAAFVTGAAFTADGGRLASL